MNKSISGGLLAGIFIVMSGVSVKAQYATEFTQIMNNTQLVQIQANAALQLEAEIRAIMGLNFHSAADVIRGMDQVTSSLGRTGLVSYDAVQAEQQLLNVYRDMNLVKNMPAGTRNIEPLLNRYTSMIQNTNSALKEATIIRAKAVQADRENQARAQATMTASDAAPGTTAAIQAGNQLTGNVLGELTRMHSTMVSYQQANQNIIDENRANEEIARLLVAKSLEGMGTGKDGPYVDPFKTAPN